MKKSLLSLAALVLWASTIYGVVNALAIGDVLPTDAPITPTAYTQLLNDYDSDWWYTDDSIAITCEVEWGNVTINSPRIEDAIFETAPSYNLFLSPYRVAQIREWNPDVDIMSIIRKEVEIDGNGGSASFKLSSMDLNPDQIYYGFITPLDMYDEIWTPSKEICFQLNSNLCMLDFNCDAINSIINPVVEPENIIDEPVNNEGTWEVHGAWCVGMDLAHVSHTTRGDKVTLTWTAVDGETVDIAILNPEEEVYEKLATVKMSDEKYVYTMRWNGEQNFMLTNDCGSVKYKADAAIEKTPEKIVTPATGPAENVLYIAIAAIILYGAYAIFFRKSDN